MYTVTMSHVLEETSRTLLQSYKITVAAFIAAVCQYRLYEILKERNLCGLR